MSVSNLIFKVPSNSKILWFLTTPTKCSVFEVAWISYLCCITNYPQCSGLRQQTFVISHILRVRNLGVDWKIQFLTACWTESLSFLSCGPFPWAVYKVTLACIKVNKKETEIQRKLARWKPIFHNNLRSDIPSFLPYQICRKQFIKSSTHSGKGLHKGIKTQRGRSLGPILFIYLFLI